MKQLKLSVAVLAMAAMTFTGCKKDEESRYDGQTTNFTLTTADMGGAKAHIAGDYLYWDAADPVKINGGTYSVTLDNDEAQLIDVPAAANYYAVYPASCVSGNADATTNVTFPASYTYTEDANGNQKIEAPMVAKANANNLLSFTCLTTLWKVHVPGGYTVNSITVTADKQALAGTATVNINDLTVGNITGGNTVTLNVGTPVSTDNSGKDFIVPVPEIQAGTLVTINVNTTSNTLVWCKRAKGTVNKHTILDGVNTDLFTMHFNATSISATFSDKLTAIATANGTTVAVISDPAGGYVAIFGKPITSLPEQAFKSCTNLTSMTIPNGVTTIEKSAFNGCSNLQSVTIPSSVTLIGANAFQYSGLTSVEIPSSVVEIKSGAFSICNNLTNVTCHMPSPNNISSIAFTSTHATNLTVPQNAFDGYYTKFRDYFDFINDVRTSQKPL